VRAARLEDRKSGESNAAGAFVELGLLMDFGADLADKVRFKPIVVNPDAPLAGDPLWAFSGFFLKEIREHDFQRGWFDAYQAFKAINDPTLHLYTDGAPTLPPSFTLTDALKPTYDKNLATFRARVDAVVNTLVGEVTAGSWPFKIPLIGTGLKNGIASIVDQIVNRFLR